MDPIQPLVEEILRRVADNLSVKVDETKVRDIIDAKLIHTHNSLTDQINSAKQSIVDSTSQLRLELQELIKNTPGGANSNAPTVIELKQFSPENNSPNEDLGVQHAQFAKVANILQCKLPCYVWGPTGSGKTRACRIIADKILKVPFYRKVMTNQAGESFLMGYSDAQGRYVEGIAYKAYKDGGLLLIDEMDNGNANINTCLKQLVDEERCFFPVVGNIEKHPQFYLVANANTIGSGATRQYIGRCAQDKALLNSMVNVFWPYDLEFEKCLARGEYKACGGKDEKHIEKRIRDFQLLRQAIDELQIDHIMSTRTLLQAIRMECSGFFSWNEILRSTVVKGLNKEQGAKAVKRANELESTALVVYEDDVEVISPKKSRRPSNVPF